LNPNILESLSLLIERNNNLTEEMMQAIFNKILQFKDTKSLEIKINYCDSLEEDPALEFLDNLK